MKISVSKFNDISIYKRVSNGVFLNLTEGELRDLGSVVPYYKIPNIDDDYCMTVFTGNKIFSADRSDEIDTLAAAVTIEEMLALTDISGESFVRQLRSGVSKSKSDDLIASVCAEKILNYNYGQCVLNMNTDDESFYFDFFRFKYKGSGKGRIKENTCILSKKFINVPIEVVEVNLWEKEERMIVVR